MAKPNPWAKGNRWPIAYHHAMEIQRLLFADIQNPDTKPAIRATLAKAYTTVEEMKRVLQMRPAPKPVDVGHKQVKTIVPATFTIPSQNTALVLHDASSEPVTDPSPVIDPASPQPQP